ncbi:MAG TPA: hypothetical protein DCW46_09700 [Desulfotomaculum sp.]|nr:hypothetical protein [Desulfotomaculum sp.]
MKFFSLLLSDHYFLSYFLNEAIKNRLPKETCFSLSRTETILNATKENRSFKTFRLDSFLAALTFSKPPNNRNAMVLFNHYIIDTVDVKMNLPKPIFGNKQHGPGGGFNASHQI